MDRDEQFQGTRDRRSCAAVRGDARGVGAGTGRVGAELKHAADAREPQALGRERRIQRFARLLRKRARPLGGPGGVLGGYRRNKAPRGQHLCERERRHGAAPQP